MSDGEDADRQFHGAYTWEASTRHRWVLKVAGVHVASVERSRSWVRLKIALPWHVELLGSPFPDLQGVSNNFRTLDEARLVAEREMKRTICLVANALDDDRS